MVQREQGGGVVLHPGELKVNLVGFLSVGSTLVCDSVSETLPHYTVCSTQSQRGPCKKCYCIIVELDVISNGTHRPLSTEI